MIANLPSCIVTRLSSPSFACAFANVQVHCTYDFSTIWNVSGKEA